MSKHLSVKIQLSNFLFLLIALIQFYCLVLFGIIPFDIVWGGKVKNHSEMISLEMISLFINTMMLIVVLLRAKIITIGFHPVKTKVMLYIMALLYGMNCVGNLHADTNFEKFVFTPITLLLSLLSWQLARTNSPQTKIENN